MKKIIFALILCSLLSGCDNPDMSQAVLYELGYTQVHTTGFSFHGCNIGNLSSTGFYGYNQSGEYVKGAVCFDIDLRNPRVVIEPSTK